jgi:hypothetical protein
LGFIWTTFVSHVELFIPIAKSQTQRNWRLSLVSFNQSDSSSVLYGNLFLVATTFAVIAEV